MADNEYIDFDDNDPNLFYELPKAIQDQMVTWISINLSRVKKINANCSLYQLKKFIGCNKNLDRYYYNGEFIGAMAHAGYKVYSLENTAFFNVSEQSPCFLALLKT